ncbi:MAG TPA: hypothetical protein VH186_16905 [Chloroflexia bacterium]|nr:hypothetical protein [Chloroflexia bacterium]
MVKAFQGKHEKGAQLTRFAFTEMLDEEAGYGYLVAARHPNSLYCPLGHLLSQSQAPNHRARYLKNSVSV